MYIDINQGKILGESIIENPSTIIVDNVLLVKGLKHNLLSIINLYDKGFSITFGTVSYMIKHE